MGAGKSKKEAKHAAAKMLLEKMANFTQLPMLTTPSVAAIQQNGNDVPNDEYGFFFH